MGDLEDYYWRNPTEVHSLYNYKILGYVSLTCYSLGIITFIPGMAVLTRKHMVSPVNTILMHYCATLMIAGFVYIPHIYQELFRAKLCSIPEHRTYEWEMISWICLITAAAFRNLAVWLAQMMGLWRYIAILHPLQERRYCTMEITKKVILYGYVLVFCSTTISNYFTSGVGPTIKLFDENGCSTANFSTGKNVTIYEFQVFIEAYPFWYSLTFACFGILVKLCPSGILTFVSIRLIRALLEARKRRQKMINTTGCMSTFHSKMERQISQNKNRTTIMLLIILGLFALEEVPLGIFFVLSAFYGPAFFWKYWYQTFEVVNCLIYVSEIFNFPVYYAMSRVFRETFHSFFKRKSNDKKSENPHTAGSSLPDMNVTREYSTSPSPSITTISLSCA